MPVKTCQRNNKPGYKWGDEGYCYTGRGAKKKAEDQGKAIELTKRINKNYKQTKK